MFTQKVFAGKQNKTTRKPRFGAGGILQFLCTQKETHNRGFQDIYPKYSFYWHNHTNCYKNHDFHEMLFYY